MRRKNESILRTEFSKLRRVFNQSASKIWRRGIDWIDARPQLSGIVSWEPFFVGLLSEKEAFAGRAIEAIFNRKRLLHRLSAVRREDYEDTPEDRSKFGMDTIISELPFYEDKYRKYSFFEPLLYEKVNNLSPEGTLNYIIEYNTNLPENDWLSEGSKYLENPGFLGFGGLFADAIIGELSGSPDAFSNALRSLLNQHAGDVSVSISMRDGRLVVTPSSYLGRAKIGRMTGRLTAVEAKYTNRVHLVENQLINEFEDLINGNKTTENDIHGFLEAYPEFLSLDGRTYIKSHPVLTFRDDRKRIPDFFLERQDGFCDILEIKRPDAPILIGGPNRRMLSIEVHRAIAQLREYSAFFANRLLDINSHKSEYRIYRPNLILLIGRSSNFLSMEERFDTDKDMKQGEIIKTYDDVIEMSKKNSVFVDEDLSSKIPR